SLTIAAQLAGALNAGTSNAAIASTYSTALGATLASGAGLSDRAWWDHRTLAASASENLDLAGVLVDPFGVLASFARIKVLVVNADAANTNNVVVGGAGSNTLLGLFGAATHTAIVRPGTTLAWVTGTADATGYPVVSGTGDLLQIANSGAGTSVSYSVAVIGVSV
ncbi:MAG: hypothetical protein ACRDUW_17555, partial [Pseudonocardiaceae bacterium]